MAALFHHVFCPQTLIGEIVNDLADIRQVPWTAVILDGSGPMCSGALVSNGAVRLGSSEAEADGQHLEVAAIEVHPLYDVKTGVIDVAILQLASQVGYTTNTSPVTIEPQGRPSDVPGILCTISDYDSCSHHLREWAVFLDNTRNCIMAYGARRVPATGICGGGFSNDGPDDSPGGGCKVETGAPLVNSLTGRLIGLASSHYDGCPDFGEDTVYTSVAAVSNRVQKTMQSF